MKRLLALVGAWLVLGAVAIGPVVAAGPTITRIVVNETTDVTGCDFAVTATATGHFRLAEYTDKSGTVTRAINNYALRVTYRGNGRTVSVVNTGPDRLRFFADGSFTLATTGNIELVGGVSGQAGQTLYLFTPTGEIDDNGDLVYDVTVLKVAGTRPAGTICDALAG